MKVVIPVAGVGTRLRPHTHSIPKVLTSTAGKTILEHIVDDILILNPDEIIFIIGYLGDKIKEFAEKKYKNLKLTFITQEEYNGLGAAIYLSNKNVSDNDELFIILGDTIIRTDYKKFTKIPDNVIAVKPVSDPRKFGVIETEDDKIKKFVEKPDVPPSDLAVVGLYYIRQAGKLFSALKYIMQKDIKTKGEYQLTDALQHMLEQGDIFRYFTINKWLDCGNKTNLLETNQKLLDENGSKNNGNIKNSVIIDPVFIQDNVLITNSVIGPYVSISEGTEIKGCLIKDTIIGENSSLENIALKDSLVSDDVKLKDSHKHINVGSHSELDFS